MKYKIGDSYEMLTIKGITKIKDRSYFICDCECGNLNCTVRTNQFGRNKSCGCLSRKNWFKSDHGKTGHRLHNIWLGMKGRCENKNAPNYENYGGRGIVICNAWLNDFMSFYNWSIENGYADNLTIDRIDVNGNYEPSNCKWSTDEEQANNTRKNNLIEIEGEVKSLSQWSRICGVSRQTIQRRFNKGVRGKDLLQPVKDRKAKYISGIPYIKWDKSKNSWRTELKYNDKIYFVGYVKDLEEAKRKQNNYKRNLVDLMEDVGNEVFD